MDNTIKELTLLLLYLTSWEEKDVLSDKVNRSWKGYPFEILDELNEEELILEVKDLSLFILLKKELKKLKSL